MNIIDNHSGTTVAATLQQLLDDNASLFSRADFASGYFNHRGYALIRTALNRLSQFRLLLGATPVVRPEVEREGMPSVSDVLEHLTEDIQNDFVTPQTRALLSELIQFLKRDTVAVRIYRDGFLHGKLYLFETAALLGSSNFTAAGLTGNTELNGLVSEPDALERLQAWFERHWETAEDFKAELIELLSKFVQEWTPYQIYIKALYEYFKDDILAAEEEEIYRGSQVELTEFQQAGYQQALKIIDKHGGVMIADSVGLGKTFTGKKILEHYAYYQREKALVICPAQIVETVWQKELRASGLVGVEVVSQEAVSQTLPGRAFPVENYFDHELVLIDESHNFRTHTTGRYKNIMRILTSGNQRKKVVLLTATPVNNSLFDLYHQLLLIARNNDAAFRSIGIANLKDYFKTAMNQRGAEGIFNLLEASVIRHTRQFVKKNYPQAMINGKRIHFPERKLHTVRYSLEAMYGGLYAQIVKCIEGLNFVPYALESYKKGSDVDKQQRQRGQQIVNLMKILYLKRFESSVQAFRISLHRQLEFQRRFWEALQAGRLLTSKDFRQWLAFAPTSDADEEDFDLAAFIEALETVEPTAYDLPQIRRLIQADIHALETVLKQVAAIAIEHDQKLQAFKEHLLDMRDKKVLLFSYFKDTAQYIHKHLSEDPRFSELHIRRIDSDAKPNERTRIVSAFAPRAMNAERIAGTAQEIDWLISTDVLSEGQNLQDGDTLINYDLHWNPTRMVQRAGRIDRLGSPFDMLHIFNFFPEKGLESLLNLVRNLQQKISIIDNTIGLDASILGEEIDPKTFNTLQRIESEDDSVIDELEEMSELVSSESMKQELLNYIDAVGAQSIRSIPYGVSSGHTKPNIRGVAFYFQAHGEHYLRFVTAQGRVLNNHYDIFGFMRCQPDTERVVTEEYELQRMLEMAAHTVLDQHNTRAVVATLPTPIDSVQKDLSTILEEAFDLNRFDEEELERLIERVESAVLSVRRTELKALRDGYIQHGDIEQLVGELQEAFTAWHVEVDDSTAQDAFVPLDRRELRLVCYEVLS